MLMCTRWYFADCNYLSQSGINHWLSTLFGSPPRTKLASLGAGWEPSRWARDTLARSATGPQPRLGTAVHPAGGT
eukprot:8909751-Karenia_brevis.AAC.1